MAVSQHFIAYLCGPLLLPGYLLLVFKAMRQHLERMSLGSTIPTIGMDHIRALKCPVPPIDEQRAIVEMWFAESTKMEAVLQKTLEVIDRLQEYRAALITAAVTGKIDVRKVVG